jgi:Inhibitor of vertebrate lysozyme (Ivy)
MKRIALLFALIASSTAQPANAAGDYLFDVLKQPAFHKAYVAMLAGAKHLPDWLAEITGKENYVATPETAAAIGGVTYRLFHACEAHDCAGHEFEVMFSADGTKAYGLLIDGDQPQRFFGAPNSQQAGSIAKGNRGLDGIYRSQAFPRQSLE